MRKLDSEIPIDEDATRRVEYLKLLGARIKIVRQKSQISRRKLSDISGVSQRYLAELENGGRNISIGLLLKISTALNIALEELLPTNNASKTLGNIDISQILHLLPNTTAQQKAAILSILTQNKRPIKKHRRIALIGLRGAGKSSLGALAATKLNVPFIELNDTIKSTSKLPVHEVFDLYGIEGYRRLERQSLEQVARKKDPFILAVAGGIVSNAETFTHLLNNFHTIWLKAKPEDHMARVVNQGDKRPMAGHPQAMKDLRTLLNNRRADYARAHNVIDTSGATIKESLDRLLVVISAL